jgi:hypothetical protein
MRKLVVVVALAVGLVAVPAQARTVGITASPNPAGLGDAVRHVVEMGPQGRLDVWVSATGFQRPGVGTLPPGGWVYECCPSQSGGTPSWHYRSSGVVAPGVYRFNAIARSRGSFRSSALVVGVLASVWIKIR